MATRVVINRAAMKEFLNGNEGAQAGLRSTAMAFKEAVVEASPYGRSLSWPKKKAGEPWIRRPMKHGLFKKAWKVRKIRTFYRVRNDDEFARMIEYGTANNPPYAPTRRTLRQFNGVEVNKFWGRAESGPEPAGET